jgi:hypothetical protein
MSLQPPVALAALETDLEAREGEFNENETEPGGQVNALFEKQRQTNHFYRQFQFYRAYRLSEKHIQGYEKKFDYRYIIDPETGKFNAGNLFAWSTWTLQFPAHEKEYETTDKDYKLVLKEYKNNPALVDMYLRMPGDKTGTPLKDLYDLAEAQPRTSVVKLRCLTRMLNENGRKDFDRMQSGNTNTEAYFANVSKLIKADDKFMKASERSYKEQNRKNDVWVIQMWLTASIMVSFLWALAVFARKNDSLGSLRELGVKGKLLRCRWGTVLLLCALQAGIYIDKKRAHTEMLASSCFLTLAAAMVIDNKIQDYNGISFVLQMMFYLLFMSSVIRLHVSAGIGGMMWFMWSMGQVVDNDNPMSAAQLQGQVILYAYTLFFAASGGYWLQVLSRRNFILEHMYKVLMFESKVGGHAS